VTNILITVIDKLLSANEIICRCELFFMRLCEVICLLSHNVRTVVVGSVGRKLTIGTRLELYANWGIRLLAIIY